VRLEKLPPGGAYLIGLGVVTLALMIFGAYLFYRSQQVSLNTGALILIPLAGIIILWILTRSGSGKSG
jgi:multidrug transporter EmrE-like cation transporter